MKRAVACAAMIAALAACGDDAEPEADAVTSTSEAPTITSADPTTTTATTTFAQADDPPELVNTGEDFDAIVRSFVAYGSWLGTHPSVEGLSELVREGSPEWSRLEPLYREVLRNGWRDDGTGPAEVVETRVLERPAPAVAIVYVVLDNPAFNLVDAADQVVREVPAEPRTSWAYELRRDGSERWLIENRTLLGELS